MSKELPILKRLLTAKMKQQIPIQTEWTKVKSVDWNEKTMVAIGELNDLEYHDVVLGLGSILTKPKVGSLALVGSIHNGEACFLISCEEFEAIEVTDQSGFKLSLNNGLLTMNGSNFGGIVNAVELKQQLAKNNLLLQQIQDAFNNWTPVANDGGAALKTASAIFTALPLGDFANIENDKIKHGHA